MCVQLERGAYARQPQDAIRHARSNEHNKTRCLARSRLMMLLIIPAWCGKAEYLLQCSAVSTPKQTMTNISTVCVWCVSQYMIHAGISRVRMRLGITGLKRLIAHIHVCPMSFCSSSCPEQRTKNGIYTAVLIVVCGLCADSCWYKREQYTNMQIGLIDLSDCA